MLNPRKGLLLVKPYVPENESKWLVVDTLGLFKRGVQVACHKDDNDFFKNGTVVVYTHGESIYIDREQFFLVEVEDVRGILSLNKEYKVPMVY